MSLGPLAFFESRTPTLLATYATSTQSVPPPPPLWLLLRQPPLLSVGMPGISLSLEFTRQVGKELPRVWTIEGDSSDSFEDVSAASHLLIGLQELARGLVLQVHERWVLLEAEDLERSVGCATGTGRDRNDTNGAL